METISITGVGSARTVKFLSQSLVKANTIKVNKPTNCLPCLLNGHGPSWFIMILAVTKLRIFSYDLYDSSLYRGQYHQPLAHTFCPRAIALHVIYRRSLYQSLDEVNKDVGIWVWKCLSHYCKRDLPVKYQVKSIQTFFESPLCKLWTKRLVIHHHHRSCGIRRLPESCIQINNRTSPINRTRNQDSEDHATFIRKLQNLLKST